MPGDSGVMLVELRLSWLVRLAGRFAVIVVVLLRCEMRTCARFPGCDAMWWRGSFGCHAVLRSLGGRLPLSCCLEAVPWRGIAWIMW
jgi:hypothetical protein